MAYTRLATQLNYQLFCYLTFSILLFLSFEGFAQHRSGILKGIVKDGLTFNPLFGAVIFEDSSSRISKSAPNGGYEITLENGTHAVTFSLAGFQTKYIDDITVRESGITNLDIILFPISQPAITQITNDSSVTAIPRLQNSFYHESRLPVYNRPGQTGNPFDNIPRENIQPGTDKDLSQLLKRLNGVIVYDRPGMGDQVVNIFGIGARYNQVLFNGAVLNSTDPAGRSYPFAILPVEIIEHVSVQKIGDASLPADFGGGNISIQTRDFPDKRFFYIKAGAGLSDAGSGKKFYSDKNTNADWLGFPGSSRDLPADFPTNRSRSSLNQKNPQEQVFLSKELQNNLAPVNAEISKPDDRFLLGFGRTFDLKKERKFAVIAFISHQHSFLREESVVQVNPAIAANPFPFTDLSKTLINSQSSDINYQYLSQLNGVINASVLFGRNKIYLKTFFGSEYMNNYRERSDIYKPDEDTLAHSGINYEVEQRKFITAQMGGEHALGGNGSFRMNWLASYSYYQQQNPDERNILLRKDSTNDNSFELAQPLSAAMNFNDPNTFDPNFTNSGRIWKGFADHNFTGKVNILVPFNIAGQVQVLSGGVYIQSRYRVFHSDFLLIRGSGYFPLNEIWSADRYFPGGLSVMNYYSNSGNVNSLNATNRGNYTASDNLGASYIAFDNRLTQQLSLHWGLRVETNSQLVSAIQYQYFAGFKNPRAIPMDQNASVSRFDFLPSVNLVYRFLRTFQFHAAYFKSVNRPQLQELSLYRQYDPNSFLVKTGNPFLINSSIDNIDIGIALFGSSRNSFSISGFYKKINQPIENILSNYSNSVGNLMSTPFNAPPAYIHGLTGAFRYAFDFVPDHSWLSGISLFGNVNWLSSKVSAGPVRSIQTPLVKEHKLSGSPDLSLNTGLVIQYPRFPMATILFNLTGDYISELGSGNIYTLSNGNTVSAIPDYRVKGRSQLDLQVSQMIWKGRFQLILGVKNLLDNPYIVYQDLNGNKKFDTPLSLKTDGNGKGGFYKSGIDNTVSNVRSQKTYYFTLSYIFK